MNSESNNLTVFPRRASGLVKSIGITGAIVFGVHCISLSSSGFIPFSWVASVWPGASIIGLLLVAMLVSMLHGYTFASIGIAMPRSGADYVLASRLLNPSLAFSASWTLVIFSGIVAGGLIAWIPKSAIPALLQPMSIIFGNETYSRLAVYSSSTEGSFLIGSFCVLITLGLMLFPNRLILRTMSAGLILGLVAWAIILWSLIDSTPETFRQSWNHFMGTSSAFGFFDQRVELAKKVGMVISDSRTTMTLAGLIMGFWIFYGYYIPTFFSGEVQNAESSRTLLIASWSSIIITGFIFIAAAFFLQKLVPENWIAAEGFLFNNQDAVTKTAGKPVIALPWITFYAAILKPIFPLIIFTAIAWIYTLINLAQTYFFYSSRIMFSWAFDRVIPEYFAYVNPKTGSPIPCVIAIAVLAEIGVIDASYGGPLGTQLTFAFFAVVTQIVSVLAITIFPYKAPEQFRLCPGFLTKRAFGIPRITIIGGLTLLYLLWMVVASFLFPAVGVSNPTNTVILLIIIATSGFCVFFFARWYRKKYEGLDLSLIYQSAPPV